jgi:hypothetical protein
MVLSHPRFDFGRAWKVINPQAAELTYYPRRVHTKKGYLQADSCATPSLAWNRVQL